MRQRLKNNSIKPLYPEPEGSLFRLRAISFPPLLWNGISVYSVVLHFPHARRLKDLINFLIVPK